MKKSKVGILDYSIGNLYSVTKAVAHVGGEAYFITHPEEIEKADYIILPGVGSFDKCYAALEQIGYIEPLLNYIHMEKPLLGICVGMQLLFSSSTEGNGSKGLGVIAGIVDLIDRNKGKKLPNIGWNILNFDQFPLMPLLSGIRETDAFYFVHSYHAYCEDKKAEVIYSTYEEIPITALVRKHHIYGCQFHVEKSREAGLQILRNFLTI